MYTNFSKTIFFVSFSIDKDTKVCYNIYRNKEHRAKPTSKGAVTMTKAQIMRNAWNFYRTIVRFSNLPHKERISAALKLAWNNAKKEAKITGKTFKLSNSTDEQPATTQPRVEVKKTVKAYVIPMWLMQEKDLYYMGRPNVVRFDAIERETAKAFRVYGEWFPKSQCNVKEIAC